MAATNVNFDIKIDFDSFKSPNQLKITPIDVAIPTVRVDLRYIAVETETPKIDDGGNRAERLLGVVCGTCSKSIDWIWNVDVANQRFHCYRINIDGKWTGCGTKWIRYELMSMPEKDLGRLFLTVPIINEDEEVPVITEEVSNGVTRYLTTRLANKSEQIAYFKKFLLSNRAKILGNSLYK